MAYTFFVYQWFIDVYGKMVSLVIWSPIRLFDHLENTHLHDSSFMCLQVNVRPNSSVWTIVTVLQRRISGQANDDEIQYPGNRMYKLTKYILFHVIYRLEASLVSELSSCDKCYSKMKLPPVEILSQNSMPELTWVRCCNSFTYFLWLWLPLIFIECNSWDINLFLMNHDFKAYGVVLN